MITRELLEAHHACAEQFALFVQHWANGGDVTMPNLILARSQGLDVVWLETLLSDAALSQYRATVLQAHAAYQAAWVWPKSSRGPGPVALQAWSAYEQARQAAYAIFEQKRLQALATALAGI